MVAGRGTVTAGTPQFSVNRGLAQTLGARDGRRADLRDRRHPRSKARITSLRKLDWDSMRVNFFRDRRARHAGGFSASYITSFYLPPAKMDFANRLVAAFPTSR